MNNFHNNQNHSNKGENFTKEEEEEVRSYVFHARIDEQKNIFLYVQLASYTHTTHTNRNSKCSKTKQTFSFRQSSDYGDFEEDKENATMKTEEGEDDAMNAQVSKPTQKEDLVMRKGQWKENEKKLFEEGYNQFGNEWRKWKKIQETFLPWRTIASLKTFSHNYLKRISHTRKVRRD